MNPEDFFLNEILEEDKNDVVISYDPELLVSAENIDKFDEEELTKSYGYFGNTENEIIIQFMDNHKLSLLEKVDRSCTKTIFVCGATHYKYFYFIDQDYVALKKINTYTGLFNNFVKSFKSLGIMPTFDSGFSDLTTEVLADLMEDTKHKSEMIKEDFLEKNKLIEQFKRTEDFYGEEKSDSCSF